MRALWRAKGRVVVESSSAVAAGSERNRRKCPYLTKTRMCFLFFKKIDRSEIELNVKSGSPPNLTSDPNQTTPARTALPPFQSIQGFQPNTRLGISNPPSTSTAQTIRLYTKHYHPTCHNPWALRFFYKKRKEKCLIS